MRKFKHILPSLVVSKAGKKFFRLTVLEQFRRVAKHKSIEWLCRCDCGKELWVITGALASGNTKSCGCLLKEKTSKNHVGKKFGRLLATERIPGPHGKTRYKCICQCGNELTVPSARLRNNPNPSCGCIVKEQSSARARRRWNYTEGQAALNRVYERYSRTARKKSRVFELSKSELQSICQSNCYFCGRKPEQVSTTGFNTGDFVYNGIDRLNNEKGYTKENSVPCCEPCNRAKLQMTDVEFLDLVERIYSHRVLLVKTSTLNWNIA